MFSHTPEHPWCLRTAAWEANKWDPSRDDTDMLLWDFYDAHLLPHATTRVQITGSRTGSFPISLSVVVGGVRPQTTSSNT